MSAELISTEPRSPVSVLADGTPCYAPVGEVIVTGALVTCHLCGRSLRSVTAHLRVHGWTKLDYCEAFGLERGQSLEGSETRKLRAAALASRLVFEPAMRKGSATGRQRARTGNLTRDAARAARGRRMPEQRRRKAAAALAAIPAPLVAQANRDRAGRHLARVAAEVAGRHGYADLGSFVLARIGQGASLAAISREAGLNKDWLSRHLDGVDPVTAEAVRRRLPQRPEARWQPVLIRFGFPDVPSYLRERHLVQHWTVNAIAAEAGLTHHTVEGSLRRHGLTRIAHAAKRHQARQRAAQVAARLGFASMADYVADRRSAGWTWDAMAAECAQPPSWLRRQAQAASAPRPCQ
jgi:AraC-like DNA-binding protein